MDSAMIGKISKAQQYAQEPGTNDSAELHCSVQRQT